MVKKRYKLPFDEKFMGYMDETAKYLLQNIQGAKLAYVQSDEISILITDFDTPETDSCFGYRLCKMQSLFASMAAGKFNQLVAIDLIKENEGKFDDIPFGSVSDVVYDMEPAAFDCKVWSVPSYNEAFGWFLYRQHDCTRNSKQQAAQTYLSHKSLLKLSADEQIAKLKEEKGIDWNAYTEGEKYGRIIYKVEKECQREVNGEIIEFTRNVWTAVGSEPFDNEDNIIRTLIPQR
jgi:tRNA(His) 5'-end guanylyltransferase